MPAIKAGLAHLWSVTLLPFDDGNGRIACAVGDLFLARADDSPQRFYSLSAQIQREPKAYCDITDLLARGVLRKSDAGGRSTGYELNDAPRQDDLRGIALTCWQNSAFMDSCQRCHH